MILKPTGCAYEVNTHTHTDNVQRSVCHAVLASFQRKSIVRFARNDVIVDELFHRKDDQQRMNFQMTEKSQRCRENATIIRTKVYDMLQRSMNSSSANRTNGLEFVPFYIRHTCMQAGLCLNSSITSAHSIWWVSSIVWQTLFADSMCGFTWLLPANPLTTTWGITHTENPMTIVIMYGYILLPVSSLWQINVWMYHTSNSRVSNAVKKKKCTSMNVALRSGQLAIRPISHEHEKTLLILQKRDRARSDTAHVHAMSMRVSSIQCCIENRNIKILTKRSDVGKNFLINAFEE